MSGRAAFIKPAAWDRAMRLVSALREWARWDSPDTRAAVRLARADLTPAFWRQVEARRRRPRVLADACWLLAAAVDDDALTVRTRARRAIQALLFERFVPAPDGKARAAGERPEAEADDDPVDAWEA